MTLRVCAHGGGVQSTAMLVLSAQGKIDFPIHLFSNVGEDSEHPDTLEYVNEVSRPFAAKHGIELVELRRTWQDGREHTLRQHVLKPGGKGVTIPLRGKNGAPMQRHCTQDFKIGPILKWLKAHGATADDKAITGIGISVDEIQRANKGQGEKIQDRVYPLLELGLRRVDCHRIITDAGLPTPPKSSCYFCPFHRPYVWEEMRRDRPDLFEKSAEIEDHLHARAAEMGHDPLYLTRFGVPLREAIGEAQDTFPGFAIGDDSGMDDGECDEGVCFV